MSIGESLLQYQTVTVKALLIYFIISFILLHGKYDYRHNNTNHACIIKTCQYRVQKYYRAGDGTKRFKTTEQGCFGRSDGFYTDEKQCERRQCA